MSAELLELSAAQAIAAIEAGELSAPELFAFYRERAQADADANGDGLNCFTWVSGENDPSDAAGPLAGVPLAVKDLFCTEGVPSQSGSRILEGYRPPYTATSVARLKEAGAALLAKTNQDEFAMGSSTENSAYGPTLNPWDRTRVPGGSSGGSAAAVAAGLAPWALGTDTGGSIRQPAALCGIVGLKPTYGAVSRYGMIAFASSLDQAGPLTRDVTDAALMLGRMIGQDPCDATSLHFPEPIVKPTAERLGGIRLGVPSELRAPAGDFADAELEPGVRDAFERALKLAEELGASVHEISLPHAPHALSAYYVLAPSEASSNLARFDGVRYGYRAPDASTLSAMYRRSREGGFGPEVKRRIMLGTYVLSAGYYDAYYKKAQQVRRLLTNDFLSAFKEVDAILTPTAPTPAFRLGEKVDDPVSMYLADIYTVTGSLAGICGISVPCGKSREGLPIGMQILGKHFDEATVFRVGEAAERLRP
jgi:aspartyl-tRNA(Asn)/glutamyl-tRNA(Gln) amidotransferase subunit A